MMVNPAKTLFLFLLLATLCSCSKDTVVIDGNSPYSTFNVSNLKIENYINRLYIDLIGREPLDIELEAEFESLKTSDLSREVRDSLIFKLMSDTTFRENEFSYKAAYVQNLYNLAKVRCLEGASDEEIEDLLGIASFAAHVDSLEGNLDGYYTNLNEIRRFQAVIDSREAFYNGQIRYHQMYSFMIDNGVYDMINMNTFNFVRASFDELLWRLPTEQEFDEAFNMIEYNQTSELFGKLGSNKNEYISILTESNEMLEGMIIWAYQIFLSRPPTPGEVVSLFPTYRANKDINWVIAQIVVTDEYANFR